jgi:hypothetical protein
VDKWPVSKRGAPGGGERNPSSHVNGILRLPPCQEPHPGPGPARHPQAPAALPTLLYMGRVQDSSVQETRRRQWSQNLQAVAAPSPAHLLKPNSFRAPINRQASFS